VEIKINVPQHILEIWNLLTLQYPDYGRGMSLEDSTTALKLYARLLADIDPELLKAATLHHIATSKWFPKVSELREAALGLVTHDELSAEEAWGEVKQAMHRYGYYRLPEFTQPLIEQAIKIIGWRNLCASENEVADRAHFSGFTGSSSRGAMAKRCCCPK
jgi:hypothetical protein